MEFTLILVTFTYVVLFGWFWFKWPRIKSENAVEDNPKPLTKISVLIPIRNEEQGILALLQDLAVQSYPCQYFEVIVLDDNSQDSTCRIVEGFQAEAPFGLQIMPLDPPEVQKGSPKKRAITQGSKVATGDWILCTDGDCRVPHHWISSFSHLFAQPQLNFISGPVRMVPKNGWWSQFQSLEFASLIGVGASTIEQGYPSMCNGANMAFRNRVFQAVNGYQGYEKIISGDDQFLMGKINSYYPKSTAFNFDPESVVVTGTSNKLDDFIQQRIRWAGKWRHYPAISLTALGIFIFGFYLLFTISVIWIFASGGNARLVAALVILKILVDYLFLARVTKMLSQRIPLGHFLLSELVYPFYTLFFGSYSQISTFRWKNRKFRHKALDSPSKPIVSRG